jgi:hypothetical protein
MISTQSAHGDHASLKDGVQPVLQEALFCFAWRQGRFQGGQSGLWAVAFSNRNRPIEGTTGLAVIDPSKSYRPTIRSQSVSCQLGAVEWAAAR